MIQIELLEMKTTMSEKTDGKGLTLELTMELDIAEDKIVDLKAGP